MDNYQSNGYNPQRPNQPVGDLGFVEAVKICFSKYAEFNGRASRSEFWWWYLFNFIVSFAVGWISIIEWIPIIGWIISLAIMIPNLAVSWRRLHDTGRSGAWWFINFIPLVGWIIFIVFCVGESEPQPNRFGDVPMR